MDIFLSRLSARTTQHELKNAVLSVLSKKIHLPLTDYPELYSCKIMEIHDEHGGIECHGLIKIRPDKAAKWFIKHSRSKTVRRKLLSARQYVIRDTGWCPPYSKKTEQRRAPLKKRFITEESLTLITRGIDSFRREH